MALTDDQLDRIEMLFNGTGAVAAAVADFRQQFPGLSLTRCDPSDMDGERPFRKLNQFNLYLVDRSDHCWRLTTDPMRATGIVLATQKAGS
jgi:hypothetical protein